MEVQISPSLVSLQVYTLIQALKEEISKALTIEISAKTKTKIHPLFIYLRARRHTSQITLFHTFEILFSVSYKL